VSADVVVVGAGICGAATAFALAERGRDVVLVDRGTVAGGTTGRGEGNVLVSDKLPGPERELAVLGRELWVSLGERFAAARVTPKGALVLGDPDGTAAAAAREPALAPGVVARHEPGDLQVDPRGLARALVADGAGGRLRVREGGAVERADPGVVVLADGERIACEHVVLACGPWAARLSGLPVEPRKGQLVALAAPPGLIRHKLFEAAYLDAVAGAGDEGVQIATVVEQTLDGDEVLVGSSRERVGFDDVVRPAVTRAMLDRAARWVPALRDLPVTRAWSGFRAWLPDGLPAIGPLGDPADGRWVTTGHEGAGVGLGPISGVLLAGLICGEPPVADPAPFDPRRFAAAPAPA
jgi:glycine/D-amino acid oxidase-like deaminating enzyme